MGEILMSYRVIQDKVVEKGTDLVVYRSDVVEDVTSVCRTLNLGGGFNGFTPSFFCEEYPNYTTKKSSDELTTS
jgi:hypothetical protein